MLKTELDEIRDRVKRDLKEYPPLTVSATSIAILDNSRLLLHLIDRLDGLNDRVQPRALNRAEGS